jgi:polyphenol oxidase
MDALDRPTTSCPVLLQSAALAHVPHAFTTRQGGMSQGPYASLNFGSPNTLPPDERDTRSNIEANIQLVLQALHCERRTLSQLHQVHGSQVVHVSPTARDDGMPPDRYGTCVQGDALFTTDPTALVGVRIADCAPVLLATADGSAVAAIHAGWRGLVAGVVQRTARALQASAPGLPVVAAIGPCLGALASEMGEDVAQQILEATERCAGHAHGVLLAQRSERGRPLIDLVRAITLHLHASGVATVDISCHACTASDASRFFSHRRDAGHTGRMLALIGPAPSRSPAC